MPLLPIAAGSLPGPQWIMGPLCSLLLAAVAIDCISVSDRVSRVLAEGFFFRLSLALATVLHVSPTCLSSKIGH